MTDDVRARILAQVGATPSPTRDAGRVHLWLILPSSVIVAGALYFAFGGANHGQGRATWFYAASSVGWVMVATLSAWGALYKGGSAVGRTRAWLLATAVGTPAALFAMMFGFAVAHPEVTMIHPERLGLKCLGLTVAAAAFPLVALANLRRSSDPVHPVATGTALGSACGASAGVMVELWCPVATPAHVALGHILPIILMALVGALLGARVIAIRGR